MLILQVPSVVPCYIGRVSADEQFLDPHPVGHIIVLPTPAPEHVGEAINSLSSIVMPMTRYLDNT